MDRHDDIIRLLERIEQNQARALDAQEKHLAIAQVQLERSNKTVAESIELQRVAVARQAQVLKLTLPIVLVLLFLLGYLVVRWRIF